MDRPHLCIKLLVMLLVMSLFSSVAMTSVGASPYTTKLYVEPSKVEQWTPAFGETFTINVSIANVSDLMFFSFKLYWNTAQLDLAKVDIQPFLNPPTVIYRNVTTQDYNATHGRYWLWVHSTGPPKNGSGALATLTYKMTYEPIWPENVTSVLNLADTYLGDSDANPIPHEVYDGEYSCCSTPPLSITTMTDKLWYWLIESVHIHGNLTLGGSPVQDGIVALQVDDPRNYMVVIRTLPTGTPPAVQIVEIVDMITCGDKYGTTPTDSFSRGGLAYVKVTVKNNDIVTRRVLTAINLYYEGNKPFAWGAWDVSVSAGTTIYHVFSFSIPYTAPVGEARVYASALTEWPRDGGTAYCPEKSATFKIKGSSSAGLRTSEQQNSGNPEGTYDLTCSLPSNGKPGNYTIYANSEYTIYAINRTQRVYSMVTFKVKVPDINNDGIVDIFDLVIIGIAYNSAEVDNPETPWDETKNWDPRADLNEDKIVDIFDLVKVGLHYGWRDP